MSELLILLAAAVAVLAGGVAAVAGFGIGSLLTPLLAVAIGAKAAVAVVAVPHAVATGVRLWLGRDAVDRRVLLRFGIASAGGGLAGAIAHAGLSSPLLALALGALLVFAGLAELLGWGRRLRFGGPWAFVAGLLSGFFGGLVGNQGGIRSAALLHFGLEPRALVATATATAMLVDAARLPVYLVTSGAEIAAAWPLVLALSAAVVAGTLLAAPILRTIPPRRFRVVLAVLLVALGLALIVGATATAASPA